MNGHELSAQRYFDSHNPPDIERSVEICIMLVYILHIHAIRYIFINHIVCLSHGFGAIGDRTETPVGFTQIC